MLNPDVVQPWTTLLPDIDGKWLALAGDITVAIAALAGVLITGVVAIYQYRAGQRERAKERELEIRKQLMVDGIRGAIQAAQTLAGASNPEIDPTEFGKRFQEGVASFSSAMTMASLHTVGMSRDLQLALMKLFMRVTRDRDPLVRRHDEFQVVRRLMQTQTEENHRIFEIQQSMMLGGEDPKKIQMAQLMIDAGHKMHREIHAEQESIWADLEKQRSAFALSSMTLMDSVMPKFYRVVGSIRADLELDGRIEEYVSAAEITSQDIKEILAEVFAPEPSQG